MYKTCITRRKLIKQTYFKEGLEAERPPTPFKEGLVERGTGGGRSDEGPAYGEGLKSSGTGAVRLLQVPDPLVVDESEVCAKRIALLVPRSSTGESGGAAEDVADLGG